MLVGPDSSGKTSSLFSIAEAHPNNKCYMIDLENKADKIRDGLYPDLTNVEVELCVNWDQIVEAYTKAKSKLKAGDWLFIDGLDKAWDMVQADYERKVNGITLSKRVEEMRLGQSSPGIDKWGWCKTKHNGDFMDTACGPAPFNVAATAWAEVLPPDTALKNADDATKEYLSQWKAFGFKPGGEKRNAQRFDTVIALNVRFAPVRYEIATYKDKIRPYFGNEAGKLWTDFEIENGFWNNYVALCEEAKNNGARVILPE